MVVALLGGTVELLQVLASRSQLTVGFCGWLAALNSETLLLAAWPGSIAIWKAGCVEERWSDDDADRDAT